MGDLFDEQVEEDWQIVVLAKSVGSCPQHKFFILTKQPQNIVRFLKNTDFWDIFAKAENLWTGISITSQADEWMIRELLRIPGKHWVSIEPFLSGPIDLRGYLTRPQWGKPNKHNMMPLEIVGRNDLIQWIIIGSHNRPKLHPCPHEWMISVVEQCRAAGVPVWVKAISLNNKITQNIADFPVGLQVREVPK